MVGRPHRGRARARRKLHLSVQEDLAAPLRRIAGHVGPQAPLQLLQLHCLDACR